MKKLLIISLIIASFSVCAQTIPEYEHLGKIKMKYSILGSSKYLTCEFLNDTVRFLTNQNWYKFDKNIKLPSNKGFYVGGVKVESSQWVTSGSNIYYNGGNVGIGISTPVYRLDVSGATRFSTSVIGGSLMDIFNAGSVTVNSFGDATILNIGGNATTNVIHNYSENPTASGSTKIINIGGSGASGSTTNIYLGSSKGGTTTITSPTLALGTGSITMSGSIGVTGTRVTKGWFTDIESTNLPNWQGTAVTTTATKLNYLTNATGTTGTNSTNIVFSTSPTFTTSVVGGSSFDVFNTTSTTINAFGAATTMAIGGTPITAITHNYSTNATANATTKTVNFATGGVSGSTTAINIGSASGTTYSAIGGAYSSSYTLKVYGTIYATGAITSNSDIRDKIIIQKIESVIDKISGIELIDYTFKKDKLNRRHLGYSAQNLNNLFPAVSIHSKDDKYEIDHLGVSAINTKAIQELIKENESLKSRVSALEVQVNEIKDILRRFELYKPTDSTPKSNKNQVVLIYK